jgi:preprotein translocase subunit SecE
MKKTLIVLAVVAVVVAVFGFGLEVLANGHGSGDPTP